MRQLSKLYLERLLLHILNHYKDKKLAPVEVILELRQQIDHQALLYKAMSLLGSHHDRQVQDCVLHGDLNWPTFNNEFWPEQMIEHMLWDAALDLARIEWLRTM